MSNEKVIDGKASLMLSPYRVLDLSDEKGFLCGKILAELGADVIKIEKPGGEPARSIGPFYHDIPHPEKSLYWFAHNTGKRGITLDIETGDGKEIFMRLVKTADIIVESFAPGYLDSIGLDYAQCAGINRRIIMTSITPFGQRGPFRDFRAYDLQIQAMGGTLFICGFPGEPPISWAGYQAYAHGGLQAAAGTVMALYHREMVGEGQHVDVSIREAMIVLTTTAAPVPNWLEAQVIKQRKGSSLANPASNIVTRAFFPCKDGYVVCTIHMGVMGFSTNALVDWMDEEGMGGNIKEEAGDFSQFGLIEVKQEQIERWEPLIAKFFLTKTKMELLDGALKRRIMLYPVSNMADILTNPQLLSRDYFVEIAHPELGSKITYPGAFFKATETASTLERRAPLVGEHNEEVYVKELGFSEEQLMALKESHVI